MSQSSSAVYLVWLRDSGWDNAEGVKYVASSLEKAKNWILLHEAFPLTYWEVEKWEIDSERKNERMNESEAAKPHENGQE